jgi:hypothetical protein
MGNNDAFKHGACCKPIVASSHYRTEPVGLKATSPIPKIDWNQEASYAPIDSIRQIARLGMLVLIEYLGFGPWILAWRITCNQDL